MEKAKSYALKLLSKKDYFEAEIKQKLSQKGFSKEEIEETVLYLKKHGFIDDDKLLERYREVAVQKGKSSIYLKRKLFSKGIYAELSYEEELKSAINLLENKYRGEKEFYNIVKFLKNRGFSYSVIQEAANKFLNGE
ncbi:regulatory protein RecX [Persephonella atlantica]|uniref:Regulatory protein RecX n=1 Tax=Persephonella atlantica TaxID=2699429 RepID=A0ABS1GK03_9AQUI|nr:regulatory protein RecX [Persephonella atlantica]MBK3333250.1 regulatory protein RecX [Persephonella atlantica]